MVDRTPQEFGGVPDGLSDSTVAIQTAIDAAGSAGDDVLITGGTFRISGQLSCPHDALRIKGDGGIRAMSGAWASQTAMLEVSGTGVVVEGDGLLLDQNNAIPDGNTIRGTGAVGLTVAGLISRNSTHAFLVLGNACTDVLVDDVDHQGSGYGVLAADPQGLARIRIRDSLFEHPGVGSTGIGIQIHCPSHGADDVSMSGVTMRGYRGEAVGHGAGFSCTRVTSTLLLGCLAELCEGDGFRWQQQSDDAVAFNCRALSCGRPDHLGDGGSGFIVYDTNRWHGESLLALACWYHGIALSGQNSSTHPTDNVIARCSALDIGRDCFHFTAQASASITRCHARDASLNGPGNYAAYHLARQGGATLENLDCVGDSNTVVTTGASTPLGDTVVRPASVNCLVNGVSGGTAIARILEDGAIRVTESGEERLLEAN